LKGYVQIDEERCKGCALCIEFCPKHSILPSEELNLKGYYVVAFDAGEECNGCGNCALMCPEVAVTVERR
jgi:2-oxoglutarate ferredoxin oxidoreductase subunit delta